MKSEITSGSSVYITSEATCSVFLASLEKYSKPILSNNFMAGLATLGTDLNAYYEFIDNVGTHYVDKVKLGAKFGYITSISTSNYLKLTSMGVNVAAAASSAAGSKLSGKYNYD